MTNLTSPQQLSDIKNGIVIFTDKGLCSDRLKDELDGVNNVFNADVNTEVGKNLKQHLQLNMCQVRFLLEKAD